MQSVIDLIKEVFLIKTKLLSQCLSETVFLFPLGLCGMQLTYKLHVQWKLSGEMDSEPHPCTEALYLCCVKVKDYQVILSNNEF